MNARTKAGRTKIAAELESIARAAGATSIEIEHDSRDARFCAVFPHVSVSCDIDTLFSGLMFHWYNADRRLCPHFADSVNQYHGHKATTLPRADVAQSIDAFRANCDEIANGAAFQGDA